MGQINADINKELLDKFRQIIFKKTGLRRGDLKKAMEEALRDYVSNYSK